MKAYMFDAESGLFEGETYEDDSLIKYVDGLTAITPPEHDKGMVPVFNQNHQVWTIVPISEAKAHIGLAS
ncbi:MAG TPA: hypothetical protein VN642_06660 [Dongiaceae bacterium]|nr:hypothetical protein [Dongiaceae bacterium]